ncbi:hypothetical protein COHA_004235 [Chlorella ohadii]|uniref:Trichohyalin-plectin-homology domain-containing protein n=1 Tax=Chlorella ohadii TaxID=2649997 RepID=A0AAD5DTB9_9CHLO|nr:hypothetical protein COHA_004235 [Chlorella ohadii]
MESLPDPLLGKIFAAAGQQAGASISLVSCSWHHVFYSEPALWRYLELAAESLHRANEAGQVQQWCAAKAGLLRRVGTLVHHMSYTQQLWTERGDVYLDDKIPAAARGHDWQLSSSVLAHLSPAILQSLRLEAVECDPAAAEVLQRLTQLTSLYYDCSNALPAVSILLPLTRLRQLEWLERRQAAGVQQVDVQQLLARLPQLHSWCLGMSFGRRVRATMQHLGLMRNGMTELPPGPYLSSLVALDLGRNRFSRLPAALSAATNLKELSLVNNHDLLLSTEDLNGVLLPLPQLQCLYLDGPLEARYERARQQESARQGIVAHLAEQRTIEAQARHREKVEAAAAARERQEKEYEQAQIAAWHEAQELQEMARWRLEEEQRAAAEAEAAAWEATRHQREVAALLERSAELRELKQKLQAAEVNLERSQQKDQRAAIAAREREYEAAMQAAMAAARQEAAAREAAEAEARRKQGQEARQALDAQLQERAELQRVAREEFEKERAAVDAVVARIEEEEAAAQEARARQRQVAQADIARFLAHQQELRQRQCEAEAAEERSVQEYLRKRREREAAQAAQQANKREAQDRAYELLKRQKEEENARREEEEALLDLLRAELEAVRARRAAEERKQRQEAMRHEMLAANQLQLQLKAERRAAEKAREDDFRRRMLARLEEEDRLEQMNAQKQRAKQAAHMREVERLLAFRRQLYQAMREAEEVEEARQAEEEARQAAIVEAERQRLLREAAAQLPRDCLPKGVFKVSRLPPAGCSALGYEDLDVVDPTAGEAKGAEGAAPLSEERAKAFSSYKDYLGKDITSLVILPVWIMQPFTMLQNMGELMEHTDSLDRAAACEDPYERLAWVLGFTMGPFGNIERPWKPFNPILGETFEYAKPTKGMKFIAEQVSHHPPVGAAHAETDLWTFDQVSAPKTKFLGNSVEVYPIGRTRIKLKPTGELFSLVPPTSKANNVIIGKTWIDTYGDMTLLNSTTGAKAYLYFTPCGWFGAGRYEINGTISREDGTPVYKLEGRWNEYLDAVKCDENGDALEGAEPLRLWTCREKPADDPYQFTHFAHELNSCEGGINPLPSDSRRRPDRALLELGNSSDAAVAKYNLEEMQRAERKERERRGESWQPRWFKPLPADAEIIQGEYSNEECPQFEFTGEYLQQEARPASASEAEVQGAGFSPWCYPDIHPQLGKESQRP